jgi:hypothetical protein
MNTKAYFKSLTAEFAAVKDRIRNLIGDRYWPGDGQWKESVIRSVLKRYLPPSLAVGSGFVLSGDNVSTQIDVLIYDGSGPLLFQEGDFIIITPDVVAGIIEVKTRVKREDVKDIIKKLDSNAQLLRKQPRHSKPFIGLFSFEDEPIDIEFFLSSLREINGSFGNYEIQCIALGRSQFIRFWEFPPTGERRIYSKWHAYQLERVAPGYFIHNVIEGIFPKSIKANRGLWYPQGGKEPHKVAEIEKIGTTN